MATQIPIGIPGLVRHAVLGDLTVDVKQVRRRYDGELEESEVFDGEIKATVQADGAAVGITLIPELVRDLAEWVDRCAARIMQAIADIDAIKAHAADDHLPIKNKDWLQDGEAPLSKPDFIKRLSLNGMNLLDDEGMDLFFDDGGLFAGHSIIVSIEEDGKPGYVQLFG
jgi:hypothetical protein